MKILILDDSAEKIKQIVAIILEAGIVRNDIEIARSTSEARKKLTEIVYDIAFIDLLIPNLDEDSPDLANSLALLRDLADRDDLNKPTYVVGLTAFTEEAARAEPYFGTSLWTVVHYDPTVSRWRDQIQKLLKYVLSSKSVAKRPEYGVDLCVLTALHAPEMEAILRLKWNWEASEPIDDCTFVQFGTFTSAQRPYRVVVSSAPRMGSVASALLADRMINAFRPRFLVMAGICAGVRGKVNLGDVILFSPSWEWASGKVVPDDQVGSYLEPSPHQIAVPEFVLARAQEMLKDKQFWTRVMQDYPGSNNNLPKLVIGPGASGPSVIADGDYAESIRQQHRKLVAIEMEAYGMCAAAAAASGPKPTCFALKSACDFADEEKSDSMQAYAAYTSARAIEFFFERNYAAISQLAGT